MAHRLFFLAAALLLIAVPATAQTTGSIRGQVVDAQGAHLPGVTVRVTGDLIRGERMSITGENGSFHFSAIPPGSYSVSAELEGWRTERVAGVRVGISSTASVPITMRSVEITETLIVTSEVPLLDVSSSSVGSNYSAEFIENLPTSRYFHDFMSVAPGISQAEETAVRFSAFGSGTSSNTWNIDGLDATAGDTGNSWWYINPDIIAEVQVLGIGLPAEFGSVSGAAVNVVTKSGTNDFRGRFSWYEQFDELTDTNVEVEDLDGNLLPHSRDVFRNVILTAGGPLRQDKLWYFGAAEYNSDAVTEPGVAPEFANPFEWWRYDLKLTASLNQSNLLEAKGHYEDYDYNFASDPFTTPDATAVEFGVNPAWGLLFTSVLSNNTFLEAHYAGWSGDDFWRSVTGSLEPPFVDFTQPVPVESQGVAYPYDYYITRDQVDVELSHFAEDFLAGDHQFKFGVQFTQGGAKTIIQPGFGGVYLYKYEYYPGYPYYYKYEQLPHYYGSEADTISAFVDDSWKITDKLTLNVGVRYDQSSADIPDYQRLDSDANPTGVTIPGLSDVVEFETVSPRVGFAYQVGKDRRGVLRGSYGKYYDGNVTGNWNSPPPEAPTIFYSYSYAPDGYFYVFSEVTSDNVALPDPNLKSPETDQYALGYEHQIGTDIAVGVQAVVKKTTNLIGWEILGDGVYEFVPFTDPETGTVYQLANIIERPTIRKGHRPGVGSLAPPGARYEQDYEGYFLTFNKRHSNGWSLKGSYGYSKSSGRIPRPFQQVQSTPFYGSRESADPNNHLNADQLLQGDRKHVFQLQSNFDLPWRMEGTAVFKWLTGRPYNRRTRVSLDQGLTDVILEPANDGLRLPDQVALDLTLGRRFEFSNGASVRFDAQLFNVFNEDAHDFWETDSYRRGQFVPSDYVLPRRVMLRFSLDF